jgi:hypothetical protein
MFRITGKLLKSVCLLSCITLFSLPSAFADEKPLLSEEIRTVLESKGAEAAKERFAEIYPSQQEDYNVDMDGIMKLGSGYMQAGEMNSGMVVMEMMSTIASGMAGAMNIPGMPTGAMAQQMAQAEKEEKARQAKARDKEKAQAQAQSRGKVRQDLKRFMGMYVDPANANRTLFAMPSCDGYLVIGPMWADVGPWWMRSSADSDFTYADSFQDFKMEFVTDATGKAKEVRHNLDGVSSPLVLQGPLPEDWPACQERPKR